MYPCWDIVLRSFGIQWYLKVAMLRKIVVERLVGGVEFDTARSLTYEFIRRYFTEYCSCTVANYSIRHSTCEVREVRNFRELKCGKSHPARILHLDSNALPSGASKSRTGGITGEVTANGC